MLHGTIECLMWTGAICGFNGVDEMNEGRMHAPWWVVMACVAVWALGEQKWRDRRTRPRLAACCLATSCCQLRY